MRRVLLGVAAIVFGLASCGGEPVALNERVFAATSMESRGAGCYLFELGSGDRFSSGSGSVTGGLQTLVRSQGDVVVVSVNEGGRPIVERTYGEPFFRSGDVDEFTVLPTSGSAGLLLRYWGKYHPNGNAGCTPLEEPKPSQ